MPTTLVSMTVQPRAMRVLPRGNWLSDAGDVVVPGVPAFLPPLDVSDRPATRLDLARWMTSPDNPLVARVFVNRLWKLVFGQGIVKSLDDFGAQGAGPTHPELLDWLATEFIGSGWDVKHMLKLMVMSATYRQSFGAPAKSCGKSIPTTSGWRGKAASALMPKWSATMLWPSAGCCATRSAAPASSHINRAAIGRTSTFPVREYEPDHGESLYRRGLYTYWCRTFLHPSLLAFDASTREECAVERPRSNTPLQALVLLNDPTYVEAARALALHMSGQGGGDPRAHALGLSSNAIARAELARAGVADRAGRQAPGRLPGRSRVGRSSCCRSASCPPQPRPTASNWPPGPRWSACC